MGEKVLNIYLDMFLTFAKVSVMTFGGGYAMLPILQREVVENKKWATDEEITDYYAVGQCTPGIIAINTATFVGYKYKGIPGGILASLGYILPSWVIIIIIAALLQNFADIPIVQNAFAGIRVCVCVLILNSVVKLFKKSVVDKRTLIIYIIVALLGIFTDLSPVIFVILAALAGIILKALEARGK